MIRFRIAAQPTVAASDLHTCFVNIQHSDCHRERCFHLAIWLLRAILVDVWDRLCLRMWSFTHAKNLQHVPVNRSDLRHTVKLFISELGFKYHILQYRLCLLPKTWVAICNSLPVFSQDSSSTLVLRIAQNIL